MDLTKEGIKEDIDTGIHAVPQNLKSLCVQNNIIVIGIHLHSENFDDIIIDIFFNNQYLTDVSIIIPVQMPTYLDRKVPINITTYITFFCVCVALNLFITLKYFMKMTYKKPRIFKSYSLHEIIYIYLPHLLYYGYQQS